LALSIAAVLCVASAPAAIPAAERNALIALYNATGGANWTNHAGWLGAAGTECTWFGIRCGSGDAAVIGIFLAQNNLSGSLPPDIGAFANLTELELYTNSLNGAVPPQIGNLAQLQRLALYSNRFTGTVPPDLGRPTKLTYFALGDNQLTGAIPAELGNLTNVEFFSFNGNLLDGPIPPELGRLQNVQALDLAYNRIAGPIPRELGQLQRVVSLDLNDNQLSGSIPPELGSISSLMFVTLANNRLTGGIPPELGRLAQLRSISVSNNQLNGTIPLELANLVQLETLTLRQNQLTGSIPAALSRLTQLTELVLDINQLSGTIPPQIGSLGNLQRLNLDANALTGTIPPELAGLSNLLVLGVSHNQLTGTLPRELMSLSKLVSLSFSENQIGGDLPSDISRLQQLYELVAFDNQLTGPIPSGIGSLTNLHFLLLGANQLTGTIPPSITNLSQLTFLDLRGNQLTGELPSDIDRMANLENISVPGNRLSGPIPAGITKLSALTTLRLEDNDFTGTIPNAIIDLTRLDFLGLRNNHLDGTVPAGIGRLTGLRTLWLGGNRLSGAIPAEIGALTTLTWIDVGNNRFTGSPPRELMNLTNLADTLSDFRYNLLSSDDAALIAFLNKKQDGGEWLRTQTLPPSNVTAGSITDRSAIISWNLASYTDDEGGYRVSVSNSAGSIVAATASKLLSSILIRGLAASTSYFVTVRTVTHPHGLQQNTLTSEATSSITLTTGAAVIAPAAIELTTSPNGLVQRGGQAENEDSFTLSNIGDVGATITLNSSGDFFTIAPASFMISGGGSQTVRVTSLPKNPGAYSGEVTASGAGVPSAFSIPIQLLSVAATSGNAVAQPAAPRIDVAGDLTGTARFTNSGTATLTGIAVSDAQWIVPPHDLITIAPGGSAEVRFSIVPAKRPATDGALTGSLRLVYSTGMSSPLLLSDGGVSVSTVTVVFTPKPSVSSSTIPSLAPGEVARFVPGVVNMVSGASRLVSDLFVSNAFGISGVRDLRLYLSSARSSPSVASFNQLDPSQSLQLASVVSSVYSSDVAVGTIQLRTTDWDKLLVNASIVDLRPSGARNSALPVFRSDRAAAAGAQIILPGVEKSDRRKTDIFVQETSGSAASATIEGLDITGKRAGDVRTVDLSPYGFTQIEDGAAATGTVVITGVSGQIVGYALVTDLQSGDRWAIVDWSRYYGFNTSDSVKVPLAEGVAGKPGRRRAAPHAVNAATKSDLTIFNSDSTPSAATITFYPPAISRDFSFAARETRIIKDIVAFLGGSGGGYVVVTPTRGHFNVSSRRYFESDSGSYGSAVAARSESSGLRLGQRQTFAGIESTAAYNTGFGVVESQGSAARVRATLVYQDGRSVYATVVSRDYQLAARGILIVDDLVTSILGSHGDLHNLQVTFQVVEGEGAVTAFVTTTDNATGQTAVRVE